LTVILVFGFRSSILSRRSWASFGKLGNISWRGTFSLVGKDSMYFRAYSFDICFLVVASGVPLRLIIRLIYSI
jgi:hypothetical protein